MVSELTDTREVFPMNEKAEKILNDGFLEALDRGDANKVKAYLEAGLDQNKIFIKGWTPLMYAAGKGYAHIMDLLMIYGADIGARAHGELFSNDIMDVIGPPGVEIPDSFRSKTDYQLSNKLRKALYFLVSSYC